MNNRKRALLALEKVYEGSAFLDEILKYDENFSNHLAMGVLKNALYLDYVIKKFSKLRLKKIHPRIRIILQMGIYELKFMNSPSHGVINELVEIAKRENNKGAANFVNAVLRNVDRNDLPEVSKDLDDYFSVKYSHPKFFVDEMIKNYGKQFTENLLIKNNENKTLSIRFKNLPTDDFIKKYGLIRIYEDFYEVKNPANIFKSEEFLRGDFYAKDKGSYTVAKTLNPRGGKILDLCASPGGKTIHISDIADKSSSIIACDKNASKLRILRENLKRMNVKNVTAIINDATVLNPDFLDKFDYILLDAPCSATGLFRRKPEIRYIRDEIQIRELSKIQKKMILNASKYLKKGARMIYSTCSLLEAENEEVIDYALKNTDLKIIEIQGKKIKKLFAHTDDSDGFSLCLLSR